jgi:23S rRNA (cytosine1962-C5)-methyltransferase
MIDVVLKKGKEKAVLHKHPWVFSGAIENVKGKPANGEIIRLLDSKKDFLAYGFYNDQSRVAVRLLEWDETCPLTITGSAIKYGWLLPAAPTF